MKLSLTFTAILLISAAGPTMGNVNSIGSAQSGPNEAQATAIVKPRNRRVNSPRKKPNRRRCRTVVVAAPKGDAVTTPSGLTYIITRRSHERQPQPGETVKVNYTGLLGSGVKFDSSLDRGQTFDFPLGKGRVIKGWDEGIAKLRVGEQATLIIPPQLAYGDRGAGGVIPPNATLIFLVELVGITEPPKTTP
ncbi:MAG TPA: FKBP-type peptidyl-prolyl cis-trans isomerase [Pyrinomonadaceae bacterium]|nr:FKBP-type peptidyl-prolyl cis-trans isomerase [Pyrinomonadaceae bacterium]